MHRPPLPLRKYSWYLFLLQAESTPGPECGRKDNVNENSKTPSGIEHATFRLVAQQTAPPRATITYGIVVSLLIYQSINSCIYLFTGSLYFIYLFINLSAYPHPYIYAFCLCLGYLCIYVLYAISVHINYLFTFHSIHLPLCTYWYSIHTVYIQQCI
jgi:hypothetical protein